MKQKTRGHLIRNKMQWIEEGERLTNFFMNQEQQNGNKKAIKYLKEIYIGYIENVNYCKIFYEELYSSKVETRESDIDEFL